MNRYTEKIIKKYVIATLDIPTLYLRKTPTKNEYCFTDNIEIATKANSRKVTEQILRYYYQDTGLDIELVIVPIEITYEIVEEE